MRISIINDDRINANKVLSGNTISSEVEVNTLQEFAEQAIAHHITMATFKNKIKTNDSVEQTQLLGFDFDGGSKSADIHEQCQRFSNHIILSSLNHNRPKLNKTTKEMETCERFHLFIPLEYRMTDATKYSDLNKYISKINYWNVDKCSDISRYFYKHSSVLYVWEKSIPLSAEWYLLNKAEADIKEQKKILRAQRKKLDNKYFAEHGIGVMDYGMGTPLEKFQRTYAYKHLINGDLQGEGMRNNLSCKIIGVASVVGLDYDTLLGLFDQYSCYTEDFTRTALEKRIIKYL